MFFFSELQALLKETIPVSFIFIYLFTRSSVTHAGLELYTVSGSPASTSRMLEYGVYYYACFI